MGLKLTITIDVDGLKNDANGRRRLNNLLANVDGDIHHFVTHHGSNELLARPNMGVQEYGLEVKVEENEQ